MIVYGTKEQCKKFPEFYRDFQKDFPEYNFELLKKIIENQNKKNPLENKVSLN